MVSPMRSRRFIQCDVFTSVPTKGNGLAVVADGEGLSDTEMQAFAAWTNLAETTFLLPPTRGEAEWRSVEVRELGEPAREQLVGARAQRVDVAVVGELEVATGTHGITRDDSSLKAAPKGYDCIVARGQTEPDPQHDIEWEFDGKKVIIPQGKPIKQTQYKGSSARSGRCWSLTAPPMSSRSTPRGSAIRSLSASA